MKQEKIKRRLDNMIEKDRSKNFINHIIKAYIPPYNVEKIYEEPDYKFTCALTEEPLIALNDVKEHMGEGNEEKHEKNISTMFLEESNSDHPYRKTKIDGKEVGITSTKSETYLSYHTFLILYDWVVEKYFTGNKQIKRLLRGVDEDILMVKANELRDKNDAIHNELSKMEAEKRKTTTFGDLEALQKLKNNN